VSSEKYGLGFDIPEDAILHNHSRENLKSEIPTWRPRQRRLVTINVLGPQGALEGIPSRLSDASPWTVASLSCWPHSLQCAAREENNYRVRGLRVRAGAQ
jgi:hypothetical protein